MELTREMRESELERLADALDAFLNGHDMQPFCAVVHELEPGFHEAYPELVDDYDPDPHPAADLSWLFMVEGIERCIRVYAGLESVEFAREDLRQWLEYLRRGGKEWREMVESSHWPFPAD